MVATEKMLKIGPFCLAIYFFSLIKNMSANCDSEIYCRGPILERIQMSGLFADSKQFVDMPTSKSKAVVQKPETIQEV